MITVQRSEWNINVHIMYYDSIVGADLVSAQKKVNSLQNYNILYIT